MSDSEDQSPRKKRPDRFSVIGVGGTLRRFGVRRKSICALSFIPPSLQNSAPSPEVEDEVKTKVILRESTLERKEYQGSTLSLPLKRDSSLADSLMNLHISAFSNFKVKFGRSNSPMRISSPICQASCPSPTIADEDLQDLEEEEDEQMYISDDDEECDDDDENGPFFKDVYFECFVLLTNCIF